MINDADKNHEDGDEMYQDEGDGENDDDNGSGYADDDVFNFRERYSDHLPWCLLWFMSSFSYLYSMYAKTLIPSQNGRLSQTVFSNAFSSMKMCALRLVFRRNLFRRVKLTM